MTNTIDQLWSGDIVIGEKCGVGDPEIEKTAMLLEKQKETLIKELKEQHREVFEKYSDCMEEYMQLVSKNAFREGFCLAAKLVSEALLKDK